MPLSPVRAEIYFTGERVNIARFVYRQCNKDVQLLETIDFT